MGFELGVNFSTRMIAQAADKTREAGATFRIGGEAGDKVHHFPFVT